MTNKEADMVLVMNERMNRITEQRDDLLEALKVAEYVLTYNGFYVTAKTCNEAISKATSK